MKWIKIQINRIREIWNILKLILKVKNQKMILEVVDLLKDSKKNIILTTNSDNEFQNIMYYTSEDELDVEFAGRCRELMRNDLIRRLGNEVYDQNLEFFEPFTAQVFMEADYQMARADAYDIELQYYKAANDPNGLMANQLYNMWNRVKEAKEKVKKFEEAAAQMQ